jgi:hypothetical protein
VGKGGNCWSWVFLQVKGVAAVDLELNRASQVGKTVSSRSEMSPKVNLAIMGGGGSLRRRGLEEEN